jgi:hypothetical protein
MMRRVSDRELAYDAFGEAFLRRVLHKDRVLESIDRILGTDFQLGPMGAGPGRRVATLTATGTFLPCYGEEVAGPLVSYLVNVPVDVLVDLDLRVDAHRFHAEVVVPLRVDLRVVEPLTIVWGITPPAEEAVQIEITGETRRSTVLQKVAGMDGELRRFLLRFVDRELDKPHVRRATRIDIPTVIDGAWPQIADQFLPADPQDRSQPRPRRTVPA